jgi:hypothetical protein
MSDSAAYGDEKQAALESKMGAKCGLCGGYFTQREIAGHMKKKHPEGTDSAKCPHGKNPVACLDCEVFRNQQKDPRSGEDRRAPSVEQIDHPLHYGGKDNPYEAIRVIRAWGYDKNFCIGSALKYLARSGKKPGEPAIRDLEKCIWYLQDEVKAMKEREKS